MADEIAKRDQNRKAAILGVTNDASLELRMFRVDPTTGALIVSGTTALDEFPAATVLADNTATPTTTSVASFGMVYDGATWDFMRGTAADGVTVNLGTNNDVTITSGTVTETNSTAIAASLSVLDDWDESDRAKVNLIVGQAGIAGGTGVDGATVPRVTLATNVGLPAGTNSIGAVTVAARSNSVSTAAEDDRVIKASAGNLRAITMTNANAATRFLQIHNTTSAPADTAVPFMSVPVETAKTISLDFGIDGVSLDTGIYVCASSTQNTKTIAGNDHLFNAQYT